MLENLVPSLPKFRSAAEKVLPERHSSAPPVQSDSECQIHGAQPYQCQKNDGRQMRTSESFAQSIMLHFEVFEFGKIISFISGLDTTVNHDKLEIHRTHLKMKKV